MSNNTELQKLALSIADVCHLLDLSRTSVYVLINSGQLNSYSVGTRRFVSRRAVDEYIAAREAESCIQGTPCARPLRKVISAGSTA